jgi:hypothetical protein
LERLKRCLRLNYAGAFHLDILPACPNDRLGGGAILVPDRKLECWKDSNPKGFAEWFFLRCVVRDALAMIRPKSTARATGMAGNTCSVACSPCAALILSSSCRTRSRKRRA